jgi:hypothetical protein
MCGGLLTAKSKTTPACSPWGAIARDDEAADQGTVLVPERSVANSVERKVFVECHRKLKLGGSGGRVPWKGTVLERVQVPPGKGRSSR